MDTPAVAPGTSSRDADRNARPENTLHRDGSSTTQSLVIGVRGVGIGGQDATDERQQPVVLAPDQLGPAADEVAGGPVLFPLESATSPKWNRKAVETSNSGSVW